MTFFRALEFITSNYTFVSEPLLYKHKSLYVCSLERVSCDLCKPKCLNIC